MSTPSFNLTATERVLPKLALDFTTANLDSRVTFTRTTDATHPATYVNSSGVITAAANNEPRFDYDPITLNCKGLLIEESRTNLILSSINFNTTWSKTAVSVTTDVDTAPDGTLSANKLIPNTTSTNHFVSQSRTVTAAVHTVSVYAKAGEYEWLRMFMDSVGSVYFNIKTGVVGAATAASYSIKPAGNGWYRCSISGTYVAGSQGYNIYAAFADNVSSFAGDGTSGIYIWGAQMELGSFPTSYIPTTTTALTRNADVAVMTGTNFSSWYNQTEGTFFTQYQLEGWATTQSRCGLGVSDGTTASRMRHLVTSLTQSGFIGDGSGTTATLLQTVPNVTQNINKSAAGYKLNSVAACANAGNVGTNSSFTPPTVDRAYIGSIETNGASAFLNGWMQKINYYPQRLSNAEIQAITK